MDYYRDIMHCPYPESANGIFFPPDKTMVCGKCGHIAEANSQFSSPSSTLPLSESPLYVEHFGRFACLPAELIDEILCLLSVPALDALRFTNRTWWRQIMGSPIILASALGRTIPANIRELSITIDLSAGLTEVYQHPDSWRIRFQVRDAYVQLPEIQGSKFDPRYKFDAVKVSGEGNILVLRMPQVHWSRMRNSLRESSTLLFYNLETGCFPLCIGYASHVKVNGLLEVPSLTEIKDRSGWTADVVIDSHSQRYTIDRRNGWPGNESPYILRAHPDHCDEPTFSRLPTNRESVENDHKAINYRDWQILSRIFPHDGNPDCDGLQGTLAVPTLDSSLPELCSLHDSSNLTTDTAKDKSPFVLALHHPTQELHIVQIKTETLYDKALTEPSNVTKSLAILSSHVPNSVFRNVAVAPNPVQDSKDHRVTRVAVLWQHSPITLTARSELYLYELPTTLFENPPPKISQTADSLLACPPTLPGKRIISLPLPLGGVHAYSSLYVAPPKTPQPNYLRKYGTPTEILSHASDTGGLLFPARPPTLRPTEVFSKLLVWGPVSATKIHLKIIDFSYADPRRMEACSRGLTPGGKGWGEGVDLRERITGCACSLHDERWIVTTPDVSVPYVPNVLTGRERGKSLFNWSRGGGAGWLKGWWAAGEERARSNLGSVEQWDSDEQRAAMERRERWRERKIVGMKMAGMTDEEVRSVWPTVWWSGLGLRSRGWEREWEGWARDMGLE